MSSATETESAAAYGTNFTETEALLAVQSGDEDAARDIIAEMLPGERKGLAVAAYRLYEMLLQAERAAGQW